MQKRYRGFLKAMKENHIEFDKNDLYETTVEYEGGVEVARKILQSKSDITAVVATADVMAIGMMKGFFEAGVKIPEQISIIGFDDLDISKFMTPGLTTIRQPISQKGERAVELLVENIENPNMKKVDEIFPVELIERGSVAERKGK